MDLTRRQLLRGAAAGLTATLVPNVFTRPGRAALTDPVLVALYLRGAADGLNLVVPHGDPGYYDLRPTVRVAPGDELDLDGFYGFHPALAPLLPLFQSGALAVVHACGSPHESRSHFDAQDFMERAAPGDPQVTTGWLNRYLETQFGLESHTGITLDAATHLALAGPVASLAFESIADFDIANPRRNKRRDALDAMFGHVPGDVLGTAATGAFAAIDLLATVSTETTVAYPGSKLGAALRDAAALVKADIGVKVLCVDVGGWDHHTNEVARIAASAGDLAASLAAFHEDLGEHSPRTLALCMTEFGRTADENGSGGTDHGHGSVMLALAGGVSGGRVITAGDQWPGLQPGELYEGRDLAVTTDFRDVFGEVLQTHMGLADLAPVFPGFTPNPQNFPGLFL